MNPSDSSEASRKIEALAPWLGPVITPGGRDYRELILSLGSHPERHAPLAVTFTPVTIVGERPNRWWEVDEAAITRILQTDAAASFFEPVVNVQRRVGTANEGGTDWMSWKLPEWMVEGKANLVAVMLLYRLEANTNSTWGADYLDLPVVNAVVAAALERKSTGRNPLGVIGAAALLPREGQTLRIALGSCMYPRGLLDEVPAQRAWKGLNARYYVEPKFKPHLLLLTGDQVYVDATAGLLDPTMGDDRYRNPYMAWMSLPEVRSAMRRAVTVTLPDDHEIDDNWQPLPPFLDVAAFKRNEDLKDAGTNAFFRYQRPMSAQRGSWPVSFAFRGGDVNLFLLDTRMGRQERSASRGFETALIHDDWKSLTHWLEQGAGPKLIVTPAAVLPRHRAGTRSAYDASEAFAVRMDGWDGYPRSLFDLFAYLADNQVRGVAFLSGDEHLGVVSVARIRNTTTNNATTLRSIHSPGLYAPLPFANAQPADFLLNETFTFTRSLSDTGEEQTYEVTVASTLLEGNGFVFLEVGPTKTGWTLNAEFEVETRREGQKFSFVLD